MQPDVQLKTLPSLQSSVPNLKRSSTTTGSIKNFFRANTMLKKCWNWSKRRAQGTGKEEIAASVHKIEQLEQELTILMLPTDPNDNKNVLLEIRAERAARRLGSSVAICSACYTRYSESQKWRLDILSSTESAKGGFKEVILPNRGQKGV